MEIQGSNSLQNLEAIISDLFARQESQYGPAYFDAFNQFKGALNQGRIRAAEPDPGSATGWKVNAWVKKGILLGFRIGRVVEMPSGAAISSSPQNRGGGAYIPHWRDVCDHGRPP